MKINRYESAFEHTNNVFLWILITFIPFWITTPSHVWRSLCSANTNLLIVPHVRTTFASRGFSVATLLSGTRSHLTFATLLPPIPSVVFLKLTASSYGIYVPCLQQAFGSPSGSTQVPVPQIRPLIPLCAHSHVIHGYVCAPRVHLFAIAGNGWPHRATVSLAHANQLPLLRL